MIKRLHAAALALLLVLGTAAAAADWLSNSLAATDVSATVTFDNCMNSVWVKNAGATNEVFVCLWRNGETPVACTTTTGRQLDPGEARTWTLGSQPNQCWAAISYICSTGESTTLRGDSLP